MLKVLGRAPLICFSGFLNIHIADVDFIFAQEKYKINQRIKLLYVHLMSPTRHENVNNAPFEVGIFGRKSILLFFPVYVINVLFS